jgi:hypothetical protein
VASSDRDSIRRKPAPLCVLLCGGDELVRGCTTLADPTSAPPNSDPPAVAATDPAEQLLRLWEQGNQVDVDSFLQTIGPCTPGQMAAVLHLDQHRRWHAGQQLPVEEYFSRYPDIAANSDAAVDLIFHEFLLREQLGEQPAARDFCDRFPSLASLLECQISLHQALNDASPESLDEPSSLSTIPVAADSALASTPATWPPEHRFPRRPLSSVEDVQSLLRKRLRLFSMLSCLAFLLYMPVAWTMIADSWGGVAYSIALVATAVFAALLSGRRPFSLRALRWIEVGLVGVLLFFLAG